MAVFSKYVKPGDKLDVIPIVERGPKDGGKTQYRTKVYDVVSDDEVKLNMPMDGTKLILLPVGKEYELCFYTDSGLYQCFATVKDRYKSNNVFVVSMELTSGLRKFQRREYYRLNCVLDMKCTELDVNDASSFTSPVEFVETDFTMQDGVIVDISGGGIRFISNTKFNPETKIMFSFELMIGAKEVKFKSLGRILVSNEIENRPDNFENRVQFIDMPADERESIIRYIFEEERKIRRKEKI